MAGTLNPSRGRGGIIAAINVTPLVDVVLVLLIILMVASTYIVAQTLKVQLPKAHSSDGAADQPSTLTVLKTGGLRWNEKDVDEKEAVESLKAAVQANAEMSLVVSADKDVSHGRVVHILDIAKLAGVTKFAINVQAE